MNKKRLRCSSSTTTEAEEEEEEEEEEESTEMESIIVWQTPANPPMLNDYIFRNGRRHVRPYYFEFISHAKNRWEGKNLVKLFAEEFKGRPYEYYVNAVKCGRIQVDGKNVPISHVIRPSQKITHYLHRHEPPVMACDIQILHKEPDFVIVCKPASVPVHPCGQYRKNTVVGILEAEHGLAPLFPVHRLDRLVSGLLIIARTAAKADLFCQQIAAGMVHKRYVAKVIGVFPEEEQVVNANVFFDHKEGRSTTEVGKSFNETQTKRKSACTKFRRITTDGTHSIVLCEPITGRSHQIRVHLKYLGHPIANDVLYLSDTVFHRSKGSFAVMKSVMSPTSDIPLENNTEDVEDNVKEDFSIDPMCTNCPDLIPKGYGALEEGLWLHCAKYSGPDWTYECPYPDWAVLE